MKKSGQLSYTFLHETDTLPGILAKMESIRQLTLRFRQFPVNIPAWVDKMNIGKLDIEGSLSDAEETQLRQRFPNADISNTAKWKWNEDFAIKEVSDSVKVIETPTISIDEALEGSVAFDPYDIRQVLE